MANIRSRGGWNSHRSVSLEVFVGDCFNQPEPNPALKLIDEMPKDFYRYYIRDDHSWRNPYATSSQGVMYNHIIQQQRAPIILPTWGEE